MKNLHEKLMDVNEQPERLRRSGEDERYKVNILLLSEHGRFTSRDIGTLINKLLDHTRLAKFGIQVEDVEAREVD